MLPARITSKPVNNRAWTGLIHGWEGRMRRVGPAEFRRAGPPENNGVIEDGGPAFEASWSHPTREA